MNAIARLLFVTDAGRHSWQAVSSLVGALPLERFRTTVAVVGPAPSSRARDELVQLAPHATLTLLDGPVETEGDRWEELEALRAKLLLFCERSRPDVIHTTQLCLGKLASSGPRVVTATHDLLAWSRVTGRTPPASLDRYKAEAKAGLDAANVVVAPSAFAARQLERHYELADSVRVIRHGTTPALRATSERGLVGLACGDLGDPAEHLDLLVQAASRLPGPVGVIGETAQELPKPLVALGTPAQKERLALMAGARIYIGLSRYDPAGLRVAEAQAAGARLVLLDTPMHRELWAGAADLVHDADSLANAVRRAAAAPRAPRPTVPRLAITSTAAAYVRLYEELLSAEAPPPA
jgi:hypothetical protein